MTEVSVETCFANLRVLSFSLKADYLIITIRYPGVMRFNPVRESLGVFFVLARNILNNFFNAKFLRKQEKQK